MNYFSLCLLKYWLFTVGKFTVFFAMSSLLQFLIFISVNNTTFLFPWLLKQEGGSHLYFLCLPSPLSNQSINMVFKFPIVNLYLSIFVHFQYYYSFLNSVLHWLDYTMKVLALPVSLAFLIRNHKNLKQNKTNIKLHKRIFSLHISTGALAKKKIVLTIRKQLNTIWDILIGGFFTSLELLSGASNTEISEVLNVFLCQLCHRISL